MKPNPNVAIVILNWNGKMFLEQFLPALTAHSGSAVQLVVADNGSTDDSLSYLETSWPGIRIIRLSRNYGFARGYNAALKQVQADYYVLLNSDVEVTAGWLQPLIDLMESDEQIGACQPKLLDWKQRNLFEYAGAAGGWMDRYGYPFAKGRVFDALEEDKGQYDRPEPVFWASGACLCIRSALFHQLHGFDAYFFAHQEEIDLCWRLQLAGFQIFSCPQSVVYHVGGGTLPYSNPQKTYLNFRNNRIMLSKNLPFRTKLWIMPARCFLDAISAWKGLFSGNWGYFLAVLKAHVAFIGWWLFHRRKSVFPKKRDGLLHGYFRGNIAWAHFVQKKKTFTELTAKKG